MTAGVAVRLGIGYEDCKRVKPDDRVLQHVGVRPRGSARALRRPRPALPGVGRPRVRAGPGARGQRAELPALRHDRHRQRDALGRRVPRRAVPPARERRGPGAVDLAARRRLDVRLRRDARRRRGRAASPARQGRRPAPTRCTACTRRRKAGSRSRRSKTRTGRRCAAALGAPELAIGPALRDASRRAPRTARQLESLLEPRFTTRTAIAVDARARRARACRTRSRSTPRPASACCSTATTSASASSPSTTTRCSAGCASSASLIDFSETPGHINGPPPLVGEHTVEILEWLGIRCTPTWTSSRPTASSTGPTTTTPGPSDPRPSNRRDLAAISRGDQLTPVRVVACLAELVLQDLAARVEREGVDHLHVAGHLVVGHALAAPRDQLVGVERLAGPRARRTRSRPHPCARRGRRRSTPGSPPDGR